MNGKVCSKGTSSHTVTTVRDSNASSRAEVYGCSIPEETRKLKRLRTDGIIVLIDQPNLEKTVRDEMEKQKRKKLEKTWRLSYGTLVRIIAKYANRSCPGKVLATYLVCSNQSLKLYKPEESYLLRHGIQLAKSPDKRVHGKEKAVDCKLTRIMTQEFEGIEMLRLNGETPSNRTFCVVAGDFDYVDVVKQALKAGCNVELWFWTEWSAFSDQWDKQKVGQRCATSPGYGAFKILDLIPTLMCLAREK